MQIVDIIYERTAFRLKEAREKRGLAQTQLASIIEEQYASVNANVTQPVISNIENVKIDTTRRPNLLSVSEATVLAEALGFKDVTHVLWGDDMDEDASGETERSQLIRMIFEKMVMSRYSNVAGVAKPVLMEYVPFAKALAQQKVPYHFTSEAKLMTMDLWHEAIEWVYSGFLKHDFEDLFNREFVNDTRGFRSLAGRMTDFIEGDFMDFLKTRAADNDSIGRITYNQLRAVRMRIRQDELAVDPEFEVRNYEGENEMVSAEYNRELLSLIETFAAGMAKLQRKRGR